MQPHHNCTLNSRSVKDPQKKRQHEEVIVPKIIHKASQEEIFYKDYFDIFHRSLSAPLFLPTWEHSIMMLMSLLRLARWVSSRFKLKCSLVVWVITQFYFSTESDRCEENSLYGKITIFFVGIVYYQEKFGNSERNFHKKIVSCG